MLTLAAGATPRGQGSADLLAAAKIVGEVAAFENEYVRVRHADAGIPGGRADGRGVEAGGALREGQAGVWAGEHDPARRAARRSALLAFWSGAPRRHHRGPEATSGGVIAEGSRGRSASRHRSSRCAWDGGRLLVTTFEPMHYGEGTGAVPVGDHVPLGRLGRGGEPGRAAALRRPGRRRVLVRGADQITVLSDDPVGAAIAAD